jgi:hypothetical protein
MPDLNARLTPCDRCTPAGPRATAAALQDAEADIDLLRELLGDVLPYIDEAFQRHAAPLLARAHAVLAATDRDASSAEGLPAVAGRDGL